MKHIEGWNSCALGELLVSKNNKAKQVKTTEYALVGSFPVVDQSIDYICGYHDDIAKLIDTDLPLTVFGDHTRHTKFIDFPFIAGADGTQLMKPRRGMDDKFFYYMVAYASEKIGSYGYDRHFKHLKEYVCAYPVKKPEQTKIAEILSTVDRAIEQTEALIAKQQRIKTGLMQDLLTRGIDEHGNLRSEQTHKFKDSPLGRIPVEWEVVNLGNVSEISSGVTLGKSYNGSNTVELPYLRVANVQDGYFDLTEVKVIRIPKSNVKRYQLNVGDVLMNEGGDFDKLGRGSVWNGEIENCLHQNHVFKVRPERGKLAPGFLAAVSASTYGKAFFLLASKQSTNLASINSTQLKSFPIPLPEYDEQLRIDNLINQNVTAYSETIRHLQKLRSLKTALMQDLLTGKKRVTPLLNDPEVTS